MTIINGFIIVQMLLLLIYSLYRLFRKRSLLMMIPVCAQIFSAVIASLSFINDVKALWYIEMALVLFGIVPPAILLAADYKKMTTKIKTNGVFKGLVEQAQDKKPADTALPAEGINLPEREKQAAEVMKDLTKLPEELQKNFRKCLNHAHALIAEDNPEGACNIYDTLSKTAGSSYMLYYNLAWLFFQIKKYEDALEAYKKSLELSGDDASTQYDIYYNLGITYYMLERYEKAIRNFENAIELIPGNSQAIENLSFTYVKAGNKEKGFDTLKRAGSEEGGYRAHFLWGVLFSKAGEYSKAEDELKKSVKMNKDSIEARDELGKVLLKLQKPEEAIDVYEEILCSDRENYPAWFGKATACMKLKRWKDALECYRETIRVRPGCYTSYYNMAVAYEESGSRQEAVDAYKAAIRIFPDFINAYNNLGIVLTVMGRREEALEVYEGGISRNSEEPSLYFNMGMCLFEEGRYMEAAAAYRNALDFDPKELEIYYYLGAALTEMRHYNDAIEAYKSALEIKPSDSELHYNLAAIYAMLGRYDISVENLKRAIELNKAVLEDVMDNRAFDGMRGKKEFRQLVS